MRVNIKEKMQYSFRYFTAVHRLIEAMPIKQPKAIKFAKKKKSPSGCCERY